MWNIALLYFTSIWGMFLNSYCTLRPLCNTSIFNKVYTLQLQFPEIDLLGSWLALAKYFFCKICYGLSIQINMQKSSNHCLLSFLSIPSLCCVSGVVEAWTVTASVICSCPRCPHSGRQVSPTIMLMQGALILCRIRFALSHVFCKKKPQKTLRHLQTHLWI